MNVLLVFVKIIIHSIFFYCVRVDPNEGRRCRHRISKTMTSIHLNCCMVLVYHFEHNFSWWFSFLHWHKQTKSYTYVLVRWRTSIANTNNCFAPTWARAQAAFAGNLAFLLHKQNKIMCLLHARLSASTSLPHPVAFLLPSTSFFHKFHLKLSFPKLFYSSAMTTWPSQYSLSQFYSYSASPMYSKI